MSVSMPARHPYHPLYYIASSPTSSFPLQISDPHYLIISGLIETRHLTPLTLHQLLRAITPAVTALLLRLLTQKHYTPAAYASLALVVFGVALATTPQSRSGGKSSFPASASGVLLTLLGALLASLKSVAAAALQSDKSAQREGAIGLGMSPMELIDYISPLTLLQSFLYAWIAGEFNHLRLLLSIFSSPGFTAEEEATFGFDTSLGLFLLLNCLTALALNVASFEANRRVGALGITIAGNVKQVLIVVLDVTVGSGGPWTCGRWVGVLGTVGGSCWFVVEEGREKEKAKAKAKVLVEVKLKEKDGPRELEAGRAKG